jgi:hypothetical protein
MQMVGQMGSRCQSSVAVAISHYEWDPGVFFLSSREVVGISFLSCKRNTTEGGGVRGELIARRLGGGRANLTASSRLTVFLGDRRCPLLTRRVLQSWKGILLTGFSRTTYYRQIEGQPTSGKSDDG